MKLRFWNSRGALAAAVALGLGTSTWSAAQERDGIAGVREQDQAATRTAAELNGTQQTSAAGQAQAASNNDLLMRAGIVIDARNANRMIVERVLPNTPAFMSGLRPGDVITRVNGSPVTSLTAVAQALLSGSGNRLGLQVDRNGQSRQLNLTFTDNSARTAMRTDFGAPVLQNGQNNPATTTVGGVPVNGAGTAATTPSGVTPGLGTTTAQSAGGQAVAAGQPAGVGRGTATAPGQAPQGTAATQGTASTQAAGTGASVTGQLPTGTTGNPPIVPGVPTSPSIPGNPTSPSLQVQTGGVNQAFPGLNTAVPGVPTAAQGVAPATIPSSQGTVNPTIGGGASPTGAGTTGTVAPSNLSSQGTVNPSVGGGTTSSTSTTGAIGAGAAGTSATTGAGTSGAGVAAGTGTGGATGAGGAAGAGGAGGAGAGGTGGGAGGAGGGAGAGGT